jgi:hypothetical protein
MPENFKEFVFYLGQDLGKTYSFRSKSLYKYLNREGSPMVSSRTLGDLLFIINVSINFRISISRPENWIENLSSLIKTMY